METAYSDRMTGFTKLFSTLVVSTVWREEMHIKIVWITMLAMANRNGDVQASLPGLADVARVSLQQCEEAIEKLSGPDKYSRTKTNEGRRLKEVDGGWKILNYLKYREMRSETERRLQTREAVARHRANKKAEALTVSQGKPGKAQAEAEAEDRERTTTTPTPPPSESVRRRLKVQNPVSQEAKAASTDFITNFNVVLSRRTTQTPEIESRVQSALSRGYQAWQIALLPFLVDAQGLGDLRPKVQAGWLLRDGSHPGPNGNGATNWLERALQKADTTLLMPRLAKLAAERGLLENLKTLGVRLAQ